MNYLTAYILRINKQTLISGALVLFFLSLASPAGSIEPVRIKSGVESPGEYELKAIYLYNFLKFVKWPENSCEIFHEGQSHHIAVIGESLFNDVLKALQVKLQEKNKELQLTFYGSFNQNIQLSDCCLLFISESERDNLQKILKQIADKPVLTVADSDSFLTQGVMINFVSRKNKIRWAINRQPVNKSGLKLSAKLLDIAVKVIDK